MGFRELVGEGVRRISTRATQPNTAQEGDLWYDADAVVPDLAAADVTFDDTGLSEITGDDVQEALEAVDASLVSLGGTVYPRHATLAPWAAKNATTSTLVIGAAVADMLQFSSAQNGEIAWDVLLDSGTYTIGFVHSRDTDRGIYSVQIDDVEVATVDGYNGSSSTVLAQCAGETIASPGIHEISLKMLTKNASSSSYKGIVGDISIARTGA